MRKEKGKFRVGTSGYQYKHWKGVFYPDDMPESQWFEYYCRYFDSVEINNTFYNLPQASTFDKWREAASEDFCYALKFSRYGSHLKCLKDPEASIGAFMKNAGHLSHKLGPILVQLKPDWGLNIERLRSFLEAVPEGQRWVMEFRNKQWLCDEVFDVLKEYEVALCVHDMIDNHPEVMIADWWYFRFHADNYSGSYSSQFLSARADMIAGELQAGRDVFAYFNNDEEGYAPKNAGDLRRFVESRLATCDSIAVKNKQEQEV